MTQPIPVFTGKITAGVLRFDSDRTWRNYAQTLEGEAVEIVVRKPRSRRSLEQNAYWHGVPVRMIAEETGEEHMATHYALLGECFGYHFNSWLRREIPNKGSSRVLTVDEFSHLIEWCPPWAAHELGMSIPLPNECDYAEALG